MAKAIQQSKAKKAGRPASHEAVSTAGRRTSTSTVNAEPGRRRTRHVNGMASGEASDQLRTGTRLLTEAMSRFAAMASSGGNSRPVGDFRQAYASIVQSLPKRTRLDALDAMRQGIDAVARAESGETSKVSAAQQKQEPVATADFMAVLKKQEQTHRGSQTKAGELLSGIDMRERLQVSAQALSAALKRKRIFALTGPSGKYVYPAFFADPAYDRGTLERVCQALGDLPGSSKLHFFTSPRESLSGASPLRALAKGKVDAVLDLANAFREA